MWSGSHWIVHLSKSTCCQVNRERMTICDTYWWTKKLPLGHLACLKFAKPLRLRQRYDGWQDQRHVLPPFHSAQRGRPGPFAAAARKAKMSTIFQPMRQKSHNKKWKILCQQQQNYVFVFGGKFGGGNFPVKSLAGRHLESHLILGHALNLNFHYQRYQYLWVLWCSFLLCILGPPLLPELPWLDT